MKKFFLCMLLSSMNCPLEKCFAEENLSVDFDKNSMIIPECPEDTNDILSKSPDND